MKNVFVKTPLKQQLFRKTNQSCMLKYLEVKCLPLTSRQYVGGWMDRQIDRQTARQGDRAIWQMLTLVDSRVECIFMLFELFSMFKIFIINS